MLYWLYHAWIHSVPAHRAKLRFIRMLERKIARQRKQFLWRLRDGSYVSLWPDEALRNYGVGATCFHERRWEPHVRSMIDRLLGPGDTAFDIGANIGVFTLAMSNAVGTQGIVHSFEPTSRAFDQLHNAIVANRVSNVQSHRMGVSDSSGELELFVPADVSANASAFQRLGSGEVSKERVPVVSLDEFIQSRQIARVRLIKIDTEGCELAVLRGALKLIARDRPHLIVELNPETAGLAGWSAIDLLHLIEQVGGYRINMIVNEGKNATVQINKVLLEEGAYLDLHIEPLT